MKFNRNSKYNANALLALLVVAFAAAVVSLLLNLSEVSAFLGRIFSVLSPIIYAFLLVLVLVPAVDFFEDRFEGLLKKRKNYHKKAQILAVICTYLLLLVILSLVIWILISQLSKAYYFIAKFADDYFPILNDLINDVSNNDGIVGETLSSLAKTLKDFANEWVKSVPDFAKTVAGTLSSVVSSISSWVIAVIISIYALFRRAKLKSLCRRANAAVFSEKVAKQVSTTLGTLYKNLGAFFSARAYNMIVLAVVFYLVLLIMGLEFYSTIALTIAICSFVPVVGLLIGGGIGTLVVLVTDTDKTPWFLLAFLVIAFLDYLYLRPLITNKRVRVSLGTTIICVFVGFFLGKLLGALIALPIYVTARDAFIEWSAKKNKEKEEKEEAVN